MAFRLLVYETPASPWQVDAVLEMPVGSQPRLSLCIPTAAGRTPYLKVALASAIHEALAYPPGVVEVLVSDNGSPEPTKALLREFQALHPWLRCTGFAENQGFDPNYLNCFQEARGEFVWVLGDDDMFLPGCAAKVMAAMDAGADVILCGAFECDVEMKPQQPRGWFKQPTPATVWRLDTRQDLVEYLGKLQYMAGVFGFISAAIIRRERFLEGLPRIREHLGTGFVHVLGMMLFLASPCSLHWLPEPLFLNRLGNDGFADRDPWARMIHDLNGWLWIADAILPPGDPVRTAFMGVLRANHGDNLVRGLRIASGGDRHRWLEAEWRLLEVGYDPVLIKAVDLAHDTLMLTVPPSPNLRAGAIYLADLPMVARGARRILVLAQVGLEELLSATVLLSALRDNLRGAEIRVVCPAEWIPLLEGFQCQAMDQVACLGDRSRMEAQLQAVREFAPDLLLNLDRKRGLAGDLLAAAAGALGAAAFSNETIDNRNDPDRLSLSRAYRKLMLPTQSFGTMAQELGLEPGPARLWPDPSSRDQARAALARAGGDPSRTLAVLGDDLQALAGSLPVQQAIGEGWTVIGLGGPGTQAPLQRVLAPHRGRALNLGGAQPLGAMAAILEQCGAWVGGSPTFQALARAAGCRSWKPGAS